MKSATGNETPEDTLGLCDVDPGFSIKPRKFTPLAPCPRSIRAPRHCRTDRLKMYLGLLCSKGQKG